MNEIACPNQEQLRGYLTGKLDDDLSLALDEHLDQCPDCQALIATVDDAGDTLLSQLRGVPADDEYRREPDYHKAMAGAKALASAAALAAAEPPSGDDAAEQELGQIGEYKLLAVLGEGGMGKVYRARQTKLRRIVALKVLSEGRIKDKSAVARFEREMGAVGQLNHPNIVHAHDAREIDGTPILAMEYLHGLDLSELSKRTGNLPIADACELIRQAAVGLQYAHQAGMVHRDIKPSNLMLTLASGGREPSGLPASQPAHTGGSPTALVKILDLGLALVCSDEPNGVEMTSTGQAMGTADYMAPEQTHDSHGVDIRADIYALGCTLYKLLAGQAPFSGPNYPSHNAKLIAHAHDPIPPITDHRDDLPAELIAILDKMLAKKVDDRFDVPGKVALALESFAVGCDLPSLLREAGHTGDGGTDDKSGGSTEPFASSALVGTKPSHRAMPKPVAVPPKRRWTAWVALGLVPILILLGIVIWYKGKRYVFPDNSEVVVREDGIAVKPLDETEKPSTDPVMKTYPGTIERGEPLYATALVQRPAKLEGLQSWTIETRGHRGAVYAVAYSPDGELVASGGDDGVIRLWSARDGELQRLLCGHTSIVESLTWSPDGSFLAAAGSWGDFNLRIWEVGSGQLHRIIHASSNTPINFIAWSPHGKFIAYSPLHGFRLYDVEADTQRVAFESRAKTPFAWSPDEKLIAIQNSETQIDLWDIHSREVQKELKTKNVIKQVVWSADGKLIAAREQEELVEVWDAVTAESLLSLHAEVSHIAFSPDSSLLTAVAGGKILRWEVASGRSLPFVEIGSTGKQLLSLSPNGEHIACRTDSGNIEVIDISGGKGKVLWSHSGYPVPNSPRCNLAPDGTRLALSGERETRVINFAGNGNATRIVPIGGTGTSWSPDGATLAIGDGHNSPAVYFALADLSECTAFKSSPGGFWHQFDWAPDADVVAVASSGSGTVVLYEVNTNGDGLSKALELKMDDPDVRLSSLAWSHDGTSLAVGSVGGGIYVWDASVGTLLKKIKGHATVVRTMTWSPDGKTLASYGDDPTLAFWNMETGERRSIEARGAEGVFRPELVAFSPAGDVAAVTGYQTRIQLWDLRSGEWLRELDNSHDAKAIWFSESGSVLTTLSNEKTVEKWETEFWRRISSRQGPAFKGRQTASQRHDIVASTTEARDIHVWRTDTGDPIVTVGVLEDRVFFVSPEGNYRVASGSEEVSSDELVYVVVTDSGEQLILPPSQFESEYGWSNDPTKVSLIPIEPDEARQPQSSADAPPVSEKPPGPGP